MFDWGARRRRREESDERLRVAEHLERQQERELFLAAIQSMTAISVAQSEANRAQSESFKTLLDSFKITSPPEVRGFDEVEDQQRWMEKHGYALPEELKGLDKMGQFSALLDKLDEV